MVWLVSVRHGLTQLSVARALLVVLCWLAFALAPAEADASRRLVRHIGVDQGLQVENMRAVIHGPAGFMWFGSVGGLVRYDGEETVPWLREQIAFELYSLAANDEGLWFADQYGQLRFLAWGSAQVESVRGPAPTAAAGVSSIKSGIGNELWISTHGGLLHRKQAGQWEHYVPGTLVREVVPRPGGGAFFATQWGVEEVRPKGKTRRVQALKSITSLALSDSGALAMCVFSGSLYVYQNGELLTRIAMEIRDHERGISVVYRGTTLWYGTSVRLFGLRPGQPIERIGEEVGIRSGGELLVDREGSLWMTSFNGIWQFPEPETRIYGQRDGLFSAHARSLEQTDEGLFVLTWVGVELLTNPIPGGMVHTLAGPPETMGRINCVDLGQHYWYAGRDTVVVFRKGMRTEIPLKGLERPGACTRGPDGTLWWPSNLGLLHIDPVTHEIDIVALPEGTAWDANGIAHVDASKNMWVGVGQRMCRARVEDVLRHVPGWQCQTLATVGSINHLQRSASGELWLAGTGGVWRERDGKWAPIPVPPTMAARVIQHIRPGREGNWIVGEGSLVRVVTDPHTGAWEVVERLDTRQRLASSTFSDVLEQPDGSIWVSSVVGVTHVPAEARARVYAPPPVRLIESRANGQVLALRGAVELTPTENSLELRYAGLTFHGRETLRFRSRLRTEDPWSAPTRTSTLRLLDLNAGSYQVQVQATIDGELWSQPTAPVSVTVPQPWHQHPAFWLACLVGAGALGYGAHRMRLELFLRAQRERLRLAMDLHDEVGSGLGSISVLAGVAARGQLDTQARA